MCLLQKQSPGGVLEELFSKNLRIIYSHVGVVLQVLPKTSLKIDSIISVLLSLYDVFQNNYIGEHLLTATSDLSLLFNFYSFW